jgi:hypothetical protein
MTIGIALAAWRNPTAPILMIAADSRLTGHSRTVTDAGIKTYDIGPQLGMVSSGSSLPPMTAVEIVRPLLDVANRGRPQDPISFFDSVRTLTFFINRVAEQGYMTGESVAVGFFRSGAPGLALIRIDDTQRVVKFLRPAPGGYVAIPLGTPLGKEVLLRGMTRALDEQRDPVAAALNLMNYMVCHEGDSYATIGGGLSVGLCKRGDPVFSWPAIEIGGRRWVRGLDITDVYRGAWPGNDRVEYDEAWCTSVDQSAAGEPYGDCLMVPQHGVVTGNIDFDEFLVGDEAFKTHDDPTGF